MATGEFRGHSSGDANLGGKTKKNEEGIRYNPVILTTGRQIQGQFFVFTAWNGDLYEMTQVWKTAAWNYAGL